MLTGHPLPPHAAPPVPAVRRILEAHYLAAFGAIFFVGKAVQRAVQGNDLLLGFDLSAAIYFAQLAWRWRPRPAPVAEGSADGA